MWALTVVMFVVFIGPPLIFGNLYWSEMAAAVRRSGRGYSRVGGGLQIIAHFRAMMEEEQDRDKKREYALLLRRFLISSAPALGWFAYLAYVATTL
ncbi:MAG TPA: hypothetical protein VF584_15070 [Longimicrobium sp.]|jgi:hypothetical protein